MVFYWENLKFVKQVELEGESDLPFKKQKMFKRTSAFPPVYGKSPFCSCYIFYYLPTAIINKVKISWSPYFFSFSTQSGPLDMFIQKQLLHVGRDYMLTRFYCYEILSDLGDSHEQERINLQRGVVEEEHNRDSA